VEERTEKEKSVGWSWSWGGSGSGSWAVEGWEEGGGRREVERSRR